MTSRIITAILILVISTGMFGILVVSGCGISASDQEYIDFADMAAEEYLISINEKDFGTFSSRLGKEMLEALPEDKFLEFSGQMKDIVGDYIPGSKEFSRVEKESGYISIIYDTEYTGEPAGVIFTMVLQKVEGQIVISGSWFNSPKIRGE